MANPSQLDVQADHLADDPFGAPDDELPGLIPPLSPVKEERGGEPDTAHTEGGVTSSEEATLNDDSQSKLAQETPAPGNAVFPYSGAGWSSWIGAIEAELRSQGKWDLACGEESPSAKVADGTNWIRQQSEIKALIGASLAPEIQQELEIIGENWAAKEWLAWLEGQSKDSKLQPYFNNWRRLKTIRSCEFKSLSEYARELETVFEALSRTSYPFDQLSKDVIFMNGLGPEHYAWSSSYQVEMEDIANNGAIVTWPTLSELVEIIRQSTITRITSPSEKNNDIRAKQSQWQGKQQGQALKVSANKSHEQGKQQGQASKASTKKPHSRKKQQDRGSKVSSKRHTSSVPFCGHCRAPGHRESECWTKDPNKMIRCQYCNDEGHYQKDCWDQYPEKAPAWYRKKILDQQARSSGQGESGGRPQAIKGYADRLQRLVDQKSSYAC